MSASAFRYKGYDAHGKKVEGEVMAATIDEAERRVAMQDVTVIAILPAGARKDREGTDSTPTLRGRKIGADEAAIILRNLSVMVQSGVPFVEAIEGVASTVRSPIDHYLLVVKNEIVGGKSLSRAMRSVPMLFPPLVADMVKVAESGGRLDTALSSAASYMERAASLRRKVRTAMVYPMVMLGVSGLTLVVLIVFVMPRFGAIFSKMKTELPITTRWLMAFGDFVRTQPVTAGVAAIGCILAAISFAKVPLLRQFTVACIRRTPGIGDLLKKLALSRSFMSIATLLGASVSVMDALEHGANVAGDREIGGALMLVRSSVEHGGSLSDAMRETRVFPAMLIQMVAVGERTGRLNSLLTTCAENIEEDADTKLKAMVALVEPLMILVMGLIVGVITVSIISPIYSVVENIK